MPWSGRPGPGVTVQLDLGLSLQLGGPLRRRAPVAPALRVGWLARLAPSADARRPSPAASSSGPGAYICDRCVPAALEVIATRAPVRGSGAALRPVGEDAPELCSFYGKTRALVDGLVAGPSSLICAECLELGQEIMAQELQQ